MRAAILTRTWFGLSAGSAAAVGILLYPERKQRLYFFILYFICYLFVLICMVFVLSRIKL